MTLGILKLKSSLFYCDYVHHWVYAGGLDEVFPRERDTVLYKDSMIFSKGAISHFTQG